MDLHKIQETVLRKLWTSDLLRFSDMMAVTELTSDDFKFHLRKLIKLGLVEKRDDGRYTLTVKGKEFANRFEYGDGQLIYQPKLTTVVYLRHDNKKEGETKYLFHQRRRQPFYDYWGVIGRPVRYGQKLEEAAKEGLKEQIGLESDLTLKGFYRQRDVDVDSSEILEDKLFVVFEAVWNGQELNHWPHAQAAWMTIDEVKSQPKRFDSCIEMLDRLSSNDGVVWFSENDTFYEANDF